jgi:multiple antibiotic resistance protein
MTDDAEKEANRDCFRGNYARQAFYPLTLPLTAGPGPSRWPLPSGPTGRRSEWRWPLIAVYCWAGVDFSFDLFRLSIRLLDRARARRRSHEIVIRLSSFILGCIGVQILWNR